MYLRFWMGYIGRNKKVLRWSRPKVRGAGFTLVEIMITIGIIALLAAIAIPDLLTAKRTANEAAAQSALKSISSAAEVYAVANRGVFPIEEVSLLAPAADPPYYNREYCSQIIQGYSYGCEWNFTGYTIVAAPAGPNSGSHIFTITTGGVLTGM